MRWLLLVVTLTAQADRFIPKKEDLIFVSLKYPIKLSSMMQAEAERLKKMCHANDVACFRKHYRQGQWNLGNVYSGPGKLYPKVGTIGGTVKFDEATGQIYLRVEVLPTGGGAGTVWLERETTFASGPRLFLRELKGEWGLLPVLPFSENAWLNLAGTGMNGLPESALKDLVKMTAPIQAMNETAKKEEPVPPGVYYLEGIRAGKVTFRKELPGDMLCGREVAEAPRTPVTLFTVDKSALYEPSGVAKFETAYPRGCDSVPPPPQIQPESVDPLVDP